MDIALAPVVTGLVSIAKKVGLPKQFSPLVAIGLGIALNVVLMGMTDENFIQGIVIGLASSGLYSGGKSVLKKKNK